MIPAAPASDSQRIVQQQRRALQDELRQATRALLMTPLMGARHPAWPFVRRHAETLREWFQREAGWTLLVERDGARLYKLPGDLRSTTRGLPRFDRARCVLLCLACAVLERAEAQISLRALGERLLAQAAAPALTERGCVFTLQTQGERRALVAVCRTLLELGVLQRVAGDEEAYVLSAAGSADAQGDVLYDVHRRSLAGMLAAVRGPSSAPAERMPADLDARLVWLTQGVQPDHDEARRTAVRHRLARRLLDDPVLYLDDLDEAERAYFVNQRGIMAARLADATGLVAEHRAEGSALTDEGAELSDVPLPAEGTESHATLLVAEHLAEHMAEHRAKHRAEHLARQRAGPPEDPGAGHAAGAPAGDAAAPPAGDPAWPPPGAAPAIARSQLVAFLAEARASHGRLWRRSAREEGGEHELAAQAVQHLLRLDLVRMHGDAVVPLPALARYRLGALPAEPVQALLS